MRWMRNVTIVAGLVVACCSMQAQLDQVWNKVSKQGKSGNAANAGLSSDKIAGGLKEALLKSTDTAVASTGRRDGYFKNQAIRILLPGPLQTASRGMRMMGMGGQLDELELSMNRAAEQAAPAAKQIFVQAITRMSFADARKILSGDDTAATEYFRKTSSAQLTQAFTPIVHQSMEKVGVITQFNQLTQNPMAGRVFAGKQFNLDEYVVGKALDGLFYMLGQEEKQIRTNPAAQTTTLLKEVFSRR